MLAEGSFLFSSTKEDFLMKVVKLITVFLSFFVAIMSLFGPLVISQNQAISAYLVMFCGDFSVFKLIFYIGYLLFLSANICLFFLVGF